MVDDGNASRGHRKNIFNPAFKVTGVGCNLHKEYKHCSVIDYAGGFSKKGGGSSKPQGKQGGFQQQDLGNFGGGSKPETKGTTSVDYKKLVKDVFEAQNKARTNPASFIPKVQETLKFFKGNTIWRPGQIGLTTNEGPNAVNELIAFLKAQKPLEPFAWNEEMSMSAQDHASDIGPKGITGHTGSDGSDMTARIERYGEWESTIGENIDFGGDSGEDVIINLMTDDGNPTRGHRKNIFNPAFKVSGVGCSAHAQYRHCSVIDYAGGHTKKGQGKPSGKAMYQPQQGMFQPQQQQGNKFGDNSQFEEMKKQFEGFGKLGGQPGGMVPQQGGFGGGDDDDEPKDAISTSTKTSTTIVNGKKTVKEVKTFKMRDGSTQTIEKTYTTN